MAIKQLFKGTQPFFRYIFKDGSEAAFIGGRYMTDVESEVKELQAEVVAKHPFIYIDENEKEVDTSFAEQLEEVKAAAVAAFLAKQQEATDKSNDMGSTGLAAQLKGIATSQTIAKAAADSASGATLIPAPAK